MEGNEQLTGIIVDTALQLHRKLGPGMLESVYDSVFARALEKRGLRVERQVPLVLEFDGVRYEEVYRADLVVEKQVIVEVKAVEALLPVHTRQLVTYLRLLDLRVGLLINFGAEKLSHGLRRVLNPQATRPSIDPAASDLNARAQA